MNRNLKEYESNIGIINQYRYRSYRYDSETKMYYLNSRYYNPEWGRFINADRLLNSGNDLLGHNLYSYCWNNIINNIDKNGDAPGNLFTNMDAVAIDFGNYINAKSIAQNREYSSCLYSKVIRRLRIVGLKNYTIGKNTYTVPKMEIKKTTVYSYTEPKKGGKNESKVKLAPIGTKREAILHTHAAYDPEYGNGIFSNEDKKQADKFNIPIYVATPIGTLRKYNPITKVDDMIYDNLPWDRNYPYREKYHICFCICGNRKYRRGII